MQYTPIVPVAFCSYSDFQAYTRVKKHKTYICKPDTGCQGKGIFITKSSKDVPPGEHMICQVYVTKVRTRLTEPNFRVRSHFTNVFVSFLFSAFCNQWV